MMQQNPLQQVLAPNPEAKEDLFYGQLVIIVARWFLIFAGVLLALWSANNVSAITLPIAGMIVLMAMNFYLHARYLMKQPINGGLVYLSSVVDCAIITAIVAFWSQGQGTGLASPFFVFYYGTLLAFALVFPPRVTLSHTLMVLTLYLAVVLVISGFGDLDAQKALLERLVTLGTTAGLGAYFWRIQRGRRRQRVDARTRLLAELGA